MNTYKDDILRIFQYDLPWEELSDCNILITGATGLIGGCLVEALMLNPNRDYDVYASGRNLSRARDRFEQFYNEDGFHFFPYDVTEPLHGNVKYDYIIHAASGAYPAEFVRRPVEIIKSNVDGVAHLLDYGLNHGLKRFLYISSGEVYGEGDGRVFTEDYCGYVDITSPRSCYPSSKRAAETLCISYASEYGIDVVIARPCHVYGPYFTEKDNRVYAQFLRNVLRDENIVMKSAGEQFRSWCYVVDCVSGLLHILLKGLTNQAYNIADSHSNISIRRLAEIIADLKGKSVVIENPISNEQKGYNVVTKSIFSSSKLESLGWSPMFHIEDGLKHTLDAFSTIRYPSMCILKQS